MKLFKVTVNGTQYDVEIEEVTGTDATPTATPTPTPAPRPAAKPAPAAAPASPKPATPSGGSGSEDSVVAQMPGTIIDIDVNVGDKVTRGQKLLVLEAMKMENEIVAPQDGTVSEIRVSAGDLVNAGDALVVLS